MYNNIIWGNTATSETGNDLYVQADGENDAVGAIVNLYNDYTDFDYDNGDNLSQGGNINQDPLLTGDLRIQTGSPCIDDGLNTAPSVPDDDIDGDARTALPDIGADEYDPGNPTIADGVPYYRLYNPDNGEHMYTESLSEYQALGRIGWMQESVGYYIYSGVVSIDAVAAQPWYRVYNPNSGLHHWTMDQNERDVLVGYGWNDEGIAGYVFASE
jgi:hypothetical protein